MSKKIIIKEGDRFGQLVVLREGQQKKGMRKFVCRCDCGKIKSVYLNNLRRGLTLSCGCLQRERTSKANTTHGMERTLIYQKYCSMKSRCSNKNTTGFHCYGGRGISVCDEWLNFEPFYKWAQENGHRDDLSLERVDVNGNYCPENCTWIPWGDQAKNTRTNRRITFGNKTMILADWGRELGINCITISSRIKRGWNIEKALTTPVRALK